MTNARAKDLLLIVALTLPVSACGGEGSTTADAPEPGPGVVAVFEGGRLTADALDEELLSMPPSERNPGDAEPRNWLESVLRAMAVERLLAAEAERLDLAAEAGFVSQLEHLRRDVTVRRYVELNATGIAPPSDDELRDLYDARQEQYARPGRRRVTHMFRRRPPGASDEALRAELAVLRRRVMDGEELSAIAAVESDSQSRHNDGNLGWLAPDDLPAELAEVLFALEPGVPSEPLVTEDGAHLFVVEEEQPAATVSFDEVRLVLARELAAQRADEAIAALAQSLPLPEIVWRAPEDELAALVQAGDPEAVVLRADEYTVRLGDLPLLNARLFAHSPADPPAEILARLVQRERIYQHYRDAQDDQLAARLRRIEQVALAAQARWRLLRERAAADEQALEAHYTDHRSRFSSPLRLHVQSLEVPLAGRDDASALMGRLEAFHAAAPHDTAGLEELAEQVDGRVEDLGMLSASRLGALHTSWSLGELAALQPGRTAPPLRDDDVLRLLLVSGRQEPEPQPYPDVRERVIDAYLATHAQQLNAGLEAELLEAAGYRVVDAELASWARENLEIEIVGRGTDSTPAKR